MTASIAPLRPLLFALPLALGACDLVEVPEMADHPPLHGVTVVSKVKLDAFYPTDVLPTAAGALVIDGYNSRLLAIDAAGASQELSIDPATWAGSLRLGAGKEGHWVSDAGARVLLIAPDGGILRELELPFGADDVHEPVALLDRGAELLVTDRQHHLHWLDPQDGHFLRSVDLGAEAPAVLTDLVPRTGGGFWATDPLAAQVIGFSADGVVELRFGHRGGGVGNLVQPKGLAVVQGGLFVADSALGIVQLFDEKGQFRAALSDFGDKKQEAPLDFGHPVAVEDAGDGRLLVLDAEGPTLWTLELRAPAVAARLAQPPGRWQRSPILEVKDKVPGENGETCLQCHDGFVKDSRRNWDPTRSHHPVHTEVKRELPAFFPLDDKGQLACETCHSPHGEVNPKQAIEAKTEEERAQLERQETGSFTRLSMDDASLCIACHAGDPHAAVSEQLGVGKSHLAGQALREALERRPNAVPGEAAQADLGCVGCHAVHGGDGESLSRQTSDGRVCANCHESQATTGHPTGTRAASRPSPSLASAIPLDQQGHVSCMSCHDLSDARGESLLRDPADGGQLCASCHKDLAATVRTEHSGHGLACQDCHDPHAGKGEHLLDASLVAATARAESDPLGCTSCHGPKGKGGAVTALHPLGAKAPNGSTVSCASCHTDAHAPSKAPAAGCADCHTEQAQAQKAGGHAGHGDVACVTCHNPHKASATAGLAPAGTNPASLRCLTCHSESARGQAEAPKVAAYEHPAPVFKTDGTRWEPLGGLPLYDKRGIAVGPKENGALTCQSCHLTHGPAEGAEKLRRPDGWKEACASCHGADSLVLYRYFHQPDRRKDIVVKP